MRPEVKQKRKADILKKVYGITPERFQDIINEQGGVCPICETALSNPKVDHNHTTGAVRGVLCNKCNLGIGLLNEDPKIMVSAIEYLTNHAPALTP